MTAETVTRLAEARELFDPRRDRVYLDAATYGLPPRPTVEALEAALRSWQSGEAEWLDDWDRQGERCRYLFAELVGSRSEDVALVSSASVGVGMVAASLPAGIEVVVPDDEFTSVMYPLLVAAEERQIRLRRVAYDDLAEAIGPETDLVAFSSTRSQDGRSVNLAAVVAAAERHGAALLVDATHSVPFLPLRDLTSRIDYLVCHGYKHLLCPRGVSFFHVREERRGSITPWFANWRTGMPLYGTSYGGTYADLARDARRFDVSLAWHAWVGAVPSLELLVKWQHEGVFDDVLGLTRRLAHGLGQPEPTASIVAIKVRDADGAEASLEAMGVRCAARGGNIRLAPHVYNTEADIDRAVEALRGFA